MPIYKVKGQKDGKQKYNVRINYIDVLGAYKQITRVAYGKEEAKQLEYRLERDIKEKKPTARMTLQDLFEEYLNSVAGDVREITLGRKRTVFRNHILPTLGATPLDKLTAPVLNKWKQEIEAKGLTLATKQNIFSNFRSLLYWGVKLDYISQNVLTRIGNFKDANTIKKEMQYYTAEEYKRFSAVSKEYAEKENTLSAWDFYVFFSIAFYTGMRKGEIHALKWSDIDGQYINVRRSITQKIKGGDRETPPKNQSSVRKLQIPAPLIDVLKDHKKRYKSVPGFSNDFRICGGTKPLRDTTIEKKNKFYAETAGIKKIRIHDFRHSHASVLANSGINIQEVARRLGHSDVKQTWETYAHLYPDEEERAVKILNQIK